MRKLTYDCTYKGTVVKNVTLFKEAIAWAEQGEHYEFSPVLTEIPYLSLNEEIINKNKLKEKRLAKIAEMLQEC